VASAIAIVLEKYETLYAEWFDYPPDAFSKYISDLKRRKGMDRPITHLADRKTFIERYLTTDMRWLRRNCPNLE